jgi:hypothetical protein
MVKREEYTIEIKQICKALTGGKVIRNEAGAWTMIIAIDGEIPIDGIRTLRVEGDVRIRGRQKGRKLTTKTS